MTLLDKKIQACEEFLDAYQTYFYLMPSKFSECGLLPQMVYRAKIAFVLQFLDKMGVHKEVFLDNVSFDEECGMADDFYPYHGNFETFIHIGNPYFYFSAMENTEACLNDFIYGVTNNTQNENDSASTLCMCLMDELSEKHAKKQLKDLAEGILNDLGYDGMETFFYEEKDALFPYFFKKFYDNNPEANYEKLVLKCHHEDAEKVHELHCSKKYAPVLDIWWTAYDISKKSKPDSNYIIGFGFTNDGFNDCYDCTKTNFVYGIQNVLIHLYLFRLDKEFHFLPKRYKGGEKKIFPYFNEDSTTELSICYGKK